MFLFLIHSTSLLFKIDIFRPLRVKVIMLEFVSQVTSVTVRITYITKVHFLLESSPRDEIKNTYRWVLAQGLFV